MAAKLAGDGADEGDGFGRDMHRLVAGHQAEIDVNEFDEAVV